MLTKSEFMSSVRLKAAVEKQRREPAVRVQPVVMARWRDYKFPAWVPVKVRNELRSFWSEKWGRSPKEWHRNTLDAYNYHPLLGTRVTCKGMWNSDGRRKFAGRWVPMWNNIGRLVRNNGEVLVMSTGCILKRHNDRYATDGRILTNGKE